MAPLDNRDVRIMIPQVRRALDPGVASASAASSYSDAMIAAITADATSELLMLGGPISFPFTLSIASADMITGYPTGWFIDPEPPLEIQALISLQAALGQVFNELRGLVTTEKIVNEGGTWEYTKSVQILRDKVGLLIAQRDTALKNAIRVVPALDSISDLVAFRAPTIAANIDVIQ